MRTWGWIAIAIAGLAAAVAWLARGDDAAPGPVAVAPARPEAPKPPAAPREEYPEPPPAAPKQALTVKVVGPDGPIEKAQVSLFLASGPRHHGRALPSARGETGADGTVGLNAAIAPDDAPWLSVVAPYFAGDEVAFDGGTVRLLPLAPAHGRVLKPDRTPAASARVSTDLEPMMDTSTDAEGKFSFRIPWPGALLVEVDTLSATFTGYDSPGDLAKDVEIVLAESPKTGGRVVGRNGAGLPKVEVEVKAGALTKYFATGADGTWSGSLFVGGGAYLTYTKAGYLPFSETERELADRTEPVVLSRPSKIVGTLVTNDGLPVADAHVLLEPAFSSTTTDAKGKFTFDDVSLPEVLLEGDVDGVKAAKTVVVPEGQTVTVKLMAPPALVEVPLIVLDLEGEPAPEWKASAVPIPARGWESHASSYMGEGAIGLTKGRFRIEAVDEDHALSGGVTLDVDPADKKPIRVVVRGPDGGLGERLDGDNRAVARVKVKVVTATGAIARDAHVSCRGLALPIDDGVWSCGLYAGDEGAVEVRAETPDGAKAVGRITVGDKELVLTVRTARTLRGKVVGVLPPNAQVRAFSAMGATVVPLYTGDFLIPDQPAVRTIVCVDVGSEAALPLGCAVAVDESPLEIPIGPPVDVTFVAKDAAGAVLNEPIVYLDRGSPAREVVDGKVTMKVSPGQHVLVLNVTGSKTRAEVVFSAKGPATDLGVLVLK